MAREIIDWPLEARCPDCNGAGDVTTPEWREWIERHKGDMVPDALEDLPTDYMLRVECGTCQGTGRILTDQGRALLAFLRRHGVG